MPNGEANITNSVLEMMHADRHTVGNYRCTADNRVGQPDSREIYVNVLCKYSIKTMQHTVENHCPYIQCKVNMSRAHTDNVK